MLPRSRTTVLSRRRRRPITTVPVARISVATPWDILEYNNPNESVSTSRKLQLTVWYHLEHQYNDLFYFRGKNSFERWDTKVVPVNYRYISRTTRLRCTSSIKNNVKFDSYQGFQPSNRFGRSNIRTCHLSTTTTTTGTTTSDSRNTTVNDKFVPTPTMEEWNENIERLLDVNMYPIGFSNMPQSISLVTSWCQQVSRVLQQSTIFVVVPTSDPSISSIEPALRVLDRLFLEQEAYNQAVSAENSEVTSIRGSGGVLMSPDISSSSIATALATWKLSLEHTTTTTSSSSSSSGSNSKQHDTSLAWERVSRYGDFLANHDGSMLSQISKVIGPIRRANRSIPPKETVPVLVMVDPNEVDTNDVNTAATPVVEATNVVTEAPMVEKQHEAFQTKPEFDAFQTKPEFDDDHLLGIPLHRFNDDSDSNNTDDLIKKRNVAMDNSINTDIGINIRRDAEVVTHLNNEVMYDRALLAANDWDTTFQRLLNVNDYPIGFSNTTDPESVDVWFSEVEQLLWQTTPSNVPQALDLIDRWHNEQQVVNPPTENMRIYPMASFALNHVIHCWLTLLDANEAISDRLTPENVWDKITSIRISLSDGQDETALSLIMKAIAMIEEPEKAPIRANEILQTYVNSLTSLETGRHRSVHVNNTLVRTILKLWQQSQLPEAPSEADRLLSMLKEWYNIYRRHDQIPDDEVYATIISIWVAGASPGKAIYRAETLMNEMQREPSFVVLGTFIDALAKVGHVERAHTLLNKYIQTQTDGLDDRPGSVEPIKAFDGCNPILSIFEAYRNRLDRQPLVAIVQMERFISQLEKLASEHERMRNIFHPNVACYNVLIGGYSHLRTPHKAEGLLGHVLRLLNASTDKVIAADGNNNQAVVTLFNNVLNALAQSGEAEAVPRAVALVNNMETSCRLDPFYQPNVETYSLLLYCLANDRRNLIVDNAREAELLLERMKKDKTGYIPKPNADCYDIVLRTWCRARYPDHAETMLLELCDDIGAFNDSSDDEIVDTTFPTSVQFLIVMQGWVSVARRKNGHHQALSRVERLLQKMHLLHLKGFQTKPTITAHNMFLECLAKSEESYAPERAESFLVLMDKYGKDDPSLIPDVVIYNSVLNTWFRSNRYDAPIKATALFEKMKKMKNTVRVINTTSYIIMMGMYTQHAMPNKVQEVFDELMQTDDVKLRLPLSAYSTLLHAWSLAGKSDNIEPILRQLMKAHYDGRLIGPGKDATIAFNAVLKCLLQSKKSDGPNHASYCYVIKSLFYSNHNDASRRAVEIFNEMKNLYTESGDAHIRPDLKIYTDLISVLAKSNLPTYSVSEATAKIGLYNDMTTFDLFHTILEEMDGLVNPTCWVTQGEASLSRMAWHLTETNILSISEKVSLMFKLRRLADQHSVKLDHTILLVLKNFRQMESTESSATTSSSTTTATNV